MSFAVAKSPTRQQIVDAHSRRLIVAKHEKINSYMGWIVWILMCWKQLEKYRYIFKDRVSVRYPHHFS